MHRDRPRLATNDHGTARRLAGAVTTYYGHEVRSISRIARGMGTANWLVRPPVAQYFLKQCSSSADAASEAAALELSQVARASGVPAPLVIRSIAGEFFCSEGGLSFAIAEYFHDTTSGLALSNSEMAQAGRTLGRLHACLRGRSGLRDIGAEWLALDERRKRARFKRYLATIEGRGKHDNFDIWPAAHLHRRLDLLPRAAALLASLPPLARQGVHGDCSSPKILFRNGVLVAVVDSSPPELFLPAFEIGRPALS